MPPLALPAFAAEDIKLDQSSKTYIVQMAQDPVATYEGGVAGIPATKPAPGKKVNAKAPNALASIKALANDALTQSLPAQLRDERDHFVRNLHHPNAGEGIRAFLDKRAAQYR